MLTQSPDAFAHRWQASPAPAVTLDPELVNALGVSLRELDTLRQEGLISEMEFEQKRRQLLAKIG